MNNIPKDLLEDLKNQAVDWAYGNGLTMIKKPTEEEIKNQQVIVSHLPFSLLPSQFDQSLYQQSISLAQDFNLLVHYLSKDFNYIQNTLKDVQDDFTQSLLNIHRIIEKEGIKQNISLGIFRSDYMVHNHDSNVLPKIYQVELNTISSSFGSLSSKVFELHKYLIERNQLKQYGYDINNHPNNDSCIEIASSLSKAHQLYIDNNNLLSDHNNDANKNIVVLMIVQDGERNLFDQKLLEFTLWNNHKVLLIRRTLNDIYQRATIDENLNHCLKIDNYEISVTYFRAGYTPNDYHSQKDWDARLLIERSYSIKCPTISYHLVGAKKIQQAICKQGVLEKYLENESIQRLRQCFTGLYSLSKEDIDKETVAKAIANPNLYVMKPQREGGGNNIYNQQVKESLETMNQDQLSSYILMDKIVSVPFNASFVRERQLIQTEALYELGVFGLLITDKDSIIQNDQGGILLRTKTSNSDEGGVAAGFAVIDSIIFK
ncbi:hypothetical protein CYY_009710 [Polysphondylium violaceum]|uniref:Glutathione synthetase n=1 Tax=Polysphondylium violaceum TaxID=133409 RepID=A0A8J4UVS2_9MYCE|nr:hypothetical protein CYY_009710 [Polysphondylium violaceum]